MIMTDSESDATDAVFTDAASGTDGASRKRQLSVTEMARRLERKKAKNQNGAIKSPRQKEARGESAVHDSPVTLHAIQSLIEAGNNRVIQVLEAKFAHCERRLEMLEAENMEKDLVIKKLSDEVAAQKAQNLDLKERVAAMDANRRLSSLILACDDFGTRENGEDIVEKSVKVLNRHLEGLDLKSEDIQAAHRLQEDKKVIVKFVRRPVRDNIYERRFELFSRNAQGGRSSHSGRGNSSNGQLAPLYISESLTPEMQHMYQTLLAARRPENGEKIATVFSRRGQVICRTTPKGVNIRVRDETHLLQLLGGSLPPLPERRRGGYRRDGRGVPAAGSDALQGGRLPHSSDRLETEAARMATASGVPRADAASPPSQAAAGRPLAAGSPGAEAGARRADVVTSQQSL